MSNPRKAPRILRAEGLSLPRAEVSISRERRASRSGVPSPRPSILRSLSGPSLDDLGEPAAEPVEDRDQLVTRLLAHPPHKPDLGDRQSEELADVGHPGAVQGIGGAGAQAERRHQGLGVGLVNPDIEPGPFSPPTA